MQSLRKIAGYLRPYRGWVLISLAMVVIESLAQLAVPRLVQFVIDEGIALQEMRIIWIGAGVMLLMAVVAAAATVLRAIYAARFSQGMAFDIRNQLFHQIQTLSYANLDRTQTGQLITRVSSDVDVVRMFTSMGFMMIVRAIVLMFGSAIFLVATNARLSLILAVLIPAIAGVFYFLAKQARPLFKGLQERLADLNTIVQENLAGVEVVKAFVREKFERDRFGLANVSYKDQAVSVYRLMAFAFPVVLLITNLGTLAVLLFGGIQVIDGILSVGELVAFNNYLLTTMFPILMLGMIVAMMPAADASAERIYEILETEPDIQQIEKASPHRIQGHVSFRDVCFNYNGSAESLVLKDIDLEVEAGQQIAVIGATGSGKSTLVNLIPRFYDVDGGQLLIDGIDVREYPLQDLRSQIGVVLQQTTLFSGTIAENIAYGWPEAPLEEIEAAARAAQADDFIRDMPDGYQSQVEARGVNLSGGQRQRIAIARALLVQPSILILDDSTSSVDMETEYHLQQALERLMEGRTTFVVAQRLSSVIMADMIIVLEEGRIAATGQHDQLIKESPIYREVYMSQLDVDERQIDPAPAGD